MKKLLFVFGLLIMSVMTYGQDVVTTHDGISYNVKIIKETNDFLFLYMQGDTTKMIRRIPLSTIHTYQYNSKNDISTVKSDSILYSKFIGADSKSNVLVQQTNPQPIQASAYSSPAEKYFTNAQNFFIASTVASIAASVVIPILANNTPIPTNINSPTYLEDVEDYTRRIQNLQNAQYVLGGLSGIFVIGAGVNFSRGFIELSRMTPMK